MTNPSFDLDSVVLNARLSLLELLRSVERQIAKVPVEVGFAFDANGKVLARRVCTTHSLRFLGVDMQAMRGQMMTHNHPGKGFFSVADIEFACAVDLCEIRAVAGRRVHCLRRPAAGWNPVQFAATYASEYHKIIHGYQQNAVNRATAEQRMNDLVQTVVGRLSLPLHIETL